MSTYGIADFDFGFTSLQPVVGIGKICLVAFALCGEEVGEVGVIEEFRCRLGCLEARIDPACGTSSRTGGKVNSPILLRCRLRLALRGSFAVVTTKYTWWLLRRYSHCVNKYCLDLQRRV